MTRWNSSQVFFAALLIVLGIVLLLGNLGLLALNWNLLWPVILILFGLWLIWRAFRPRQNPGDVSWGFGEYSPDLAGKSIDRQSYSHGFGDFDLDLTRATIGDGQTMVRASHGFGDLTVVVPREISVRVHASAGMGDVAVFGQHSGGIGCTLDFQSDDYASAARKLDIDVSVGMGEVRVVRASAAT